MRAVENLRDGSLRISGVRCTMLFKRLRPGLLLTSIRGRDEGEFGTVPLELVEAEHDRFRTTLLWFIDASRASNARHDVFTEWMSWLSRNPARIRVVHVLGSEEPMLLTLDIAQHLAGRSLLQVHRDPAAFEAGMRTHGARETSVPVGRFDEPPEDIHRTPDCLSCSDYSCEFEPLSRSALLITIQGDDCGQLSNDLFDRIRAAMRRSGGLFTLLLDVRQTGLVSPRVTDEWSVWLGAFRAELKRTVVLSGQGVLPLVLSVARERMQLGSALEILTDPAPFEAAAREHKPEFRLRPST